MNLLCVVDITWVDAPEKQYPVLGTTDRIHCEVQANPPPLVSWLRNGEPIVSDDRYVIESNGLTIQNVRESDDGIYICRAVVISTGRIQTQNIKVEVQVPPRILPMDEVEVIEGEQASTSCSATGKPPPTYTWIKENTRENLATTDRFSMNPNTGLLIINHVELNDESYYKCVAENPAGHVEERVKISIIVKPRIYELMNITWPVTSNTQIVCKAYGRPLPSITFRKWTSKMPYKLGANEGNHISLENEFNQEKWETYATLSFYNLSRPDDGLYECIADNKVGTAYKNGHVTVEFPPTFEKTENLPPVWSWPDQPANLSCVAESIPNATIEWRVGGIVIEETPNFKRYGQGPQSYLIVKPYNDHRFFTFYECIASNKLGRATKKIHLREAKPPNPVMQVKMKSITATSIKFEITGPISYDGPPIRAFIVQFYDGIGLNWAFAKNYTWTYGKYILNYIVNNICLCKTDHNYTK